ncbi:TonB family protein [Fibrobacter sp. UBA2449]|uniref:TonB family protein n=1 Tax=Fibrobacter sp. UBA2449 TaxID=1946529 RepID=UPI0025BC692C|nr:TonB family protein [Fibrobacter sp. UBA2449]
MHILKLGVAIMALTASLCTSVSFAAQQKGTMKDPRDGKTYKTVKIGDQVWMAENLDFEINERNGNPGSTNDCLIFGGNGKKANCKKYGRYYSAMAAATTACPNGWRLPGAAEFKKLLDYTGNSIDLKSKKGWNTYQQPSGNGTDKYGFNAQPSGGCVVAQDAKCAYMDEGKYAYFWTSSMQWNSAEDAILQQSVPEGVAYAFLGAPHADYGFDVAPQKKAISMWYPVRCVQDEKKNVGDGLAGLLSGNANDNDQKESADFNEGDATESSSHDACKAAVAKAKNTFNKCKTLPTGSYERSICKKKYKEEKEDAENACKVTDNSCSRSASDIMEVVRQRMPGLRHIYNKFLKLQPHFQGVVSLRFTIAPGGEIISISIASSTTGYGEFDNEIKTAVSRWNFGKFKCDDGNVANETTVTVPFTFYE